jgi:hypothetical protein
MRKGLLAGFLIAFLVMLAWKPLPYLKAKREAIWATPTVQPLGGDLLFPQRLKRHQRLCIDGMPWAPQARFVQLTVMAERPTPPVTLTARGPGYQARAQLPSGLGSGPVAVPLTPAKQEIQNGTLCLHNDGRHSVAFYGVPNGGRQAASVTMTLDGKRVKDRQLTVTLLSSRSQSALGRLGELLDRMAMWRPGGPWATWLLFILALVGVPAAVGVALARAGALDDRADAAAGRPEGPRAGR